MASPMAEAIPGPLWADFDRRLKLEFHGSEISSDARHRGPQGPRSDGRLERQLERFETDWLTIESNLAAPSELSGVCIDRGHERRPPKIIILDMDSSISPS